MQGKKMLKEEQAVSRKDTVPWVGPADLCCIPGLANDS
jgi:hypothetical protein